MCNDLSVEAFTDILRTAGVTVPELSLEALAREVMRHAVVLPLENTKACSGCRALTDALNNLDEARREVVALRAEVPPCV